MRTSWEVAALLTDSAVADQEAVVSAVAVLASAVSVAVWEEAIVLEVAWVASEEMMAMAEAPVASEEAAVSAGAGAATDHAAASMGAAVT